MADVAGIRLRQGGRRQPSGGGKVRLSRHGVHYFDRRTGLNVLLDEVSVPEDRWSKAPRYMSFALTNACELRCPYCYAPKHRAMLRPDDVVRWATELDAAGCLGLGFGGGEPTSHPQFAEICERVADHTELAVTFTTHGHRISRDLADRLAGVVHFIRVSIDGIGPTYARLRGKPFDRLKAAVELVASVAPFGVNTVVTSETIDELDAVAHFAAAAGARELLLLPEQRTSHSPGLDAAGVQRLTTWITSRSHELRLAVSRTGLETMLPLADPFPDETPLEAHAHIDASGRLRQDAFSSVHVPITDSLLAAMRHLEGLTA